MKRLLSGALSLTLWSCGPAIIHEANYSKACVEASDCTAVYFGDVCTACGCPTGAIAQSARAKYDQDFSALAKWCGPRPAIACDCVQAVAVCSNQQCTLRQNN